MKNAIIRFLREEEGASAIEYALIAAMVAVVVAAFVTPVGTAVTGIFNDICVGLTGAACV